MECRKHCCVHNSSVQEHLKQSSFWRHCVLENYILGTAGVWVSTVCVYTEYSNSNSNGRERVRVRVNDGERWVSYVTGTTGWRAYLSHLATVSTWMSSTSRETTFLNCRSVHTSQSVNKEQGKVPRDLSSTRCLLCGWSSLMVAVAIAASSLKCSLLAPVEWAECQGLARVVCLCTCI